MVLLSCPTTRSSSVSKPCCPSWTQSLSLLLEAAAAPSLRGASTHPASSSGWETDAFSHPAWSVTVCLASASSFPTPDVSTWRLSELCQDSSQQGIYLLLLLQRSLWCSVFYSFLPAPLFSSPVCILLPTRDLFSNFLQFESCPHLPPATWLFSHLLSSTFAFDLCQGQRFHKLVLKIYLIIKMRGIQNDSLTGLIQHTSLCFC